MRPNDDGPPGHPRDEAWFEALFRTHHLAIRRYAARRVPFDEADDVVAETFSTAWRERDRVPDEPLPWLYRTAHHVCLHQRRSAARSLKLAGALVSGALASGGGPRVVPGADGAPAPDASAEVEARVLLDAVLAALPAADAEILALAIWEDLDAAQIGYVLDCSASTARVRLHRARRRAQDHYDTLTADDRVRGGAPSLRLATTSGT